MMKHKNSSTESLARQAARKTLEIVSRAKSSHVGSSLSCIDILTVVFSHSIKRVNLSERDVVLVSKGHAASGVYAVMAILGLLDDDLLNSYCLDGGELGGHVTSRQSIELSTGSLGHALPYANGRALSLKKKSPEQKLFVILSDGECDEGSNWEAALFASHHKLSNIRVLIDRNRLQSLKSTEDTLALEPLAEKWRSFGWEVTSLDGHNHSEIKSFIEAEFLKPSVAICDTVKGHGVSFMQNSVAWHYKAPNMEELEAGLRELSDHA